MRTRACTLFSALSVVMLAVAGCGASTAEVSQGVSSPAKTQAQPSPSPYLAEPSPTPTAAVDSRGVCLSTPREPQSDRPAKGLVAVDPHPEGLTAFWIPGLNKRPCQVRSGKYSAAVAARLAADLRKSQQFPDGNVNCPSDDGTAVNLYFAYGSGHPTEYAHVALTGCTAVSAPGRIGRIASTDLTSDLADIAPSP